MDHDIKIRHPREKVKDTTITVKPPLVKKERAPKAPYIFILWTREE